MRPRIAILAALPREIAPLVRDWPVRVRSRREGWAVAENGSTIAVCAGMGRERAARALDLAESRGPLCSVISAGYAGALRPEIKRNSIHSPAFVVDGATGERFACAEGSGTLVTIDHVASVGDKSRIATQWNADFVDMEAAAIARLAQLRGLPFRALRVVSDEAGDALPDFNRFIDAWGQFRSAAFAVHLALHPAMIPTMIRLGRDSAQASRCLARALREFLNGAE